MHNRIEVFLYMYTVQYTVLNFLWKKVTIVLRLLGIFHIWRVLFQLFKRSSGKVIGYWWHEWATISGEYLFQMTMNIQYCIRFMGPIDPQSTVQSAARCCTLRMTDNPRRVLVHEGLWDNAELSKDIRFRENSLAGSIKPLEQVRGTVLVRWIF